MNASVHSSLHPSVHPFATLSPKPLGRIKPNLLHDFPAWQLCAKATLFFTSLCLVMKAWGFAMACHRLRELVINSNSETVLRYQRY